MSNAKKQSLKTLIQTQLDEASWLLSHAQALADYGRIEESNAELARAARSEEQVSCLLEADGQEMEAAIHRVSAASCYEKLGHNAQAVTLLRAALSAPLQDDFRVRVQKHLRRSLAQAQKDMRQSLQGSDKKPAIAR